MWTTTPDSGARREPDPTGVQTLPVPRDPGRPVSDYEAVSGRAVWIALRRAHEGGMANLAGRWLDSGHRVPGYVADALDDLTNAGLLTLGEVDDESCGVRRVMVTDSGSARYVALCRIHPPRAQVVVGTPRRWARSPHDQRSHLLAERGPDQIGIHVAVCGRRLPWSVDTSAQPTERPCLTCESLTPPASRPNPATPSRLTGHAHDVTTDNEAVDQKNGERDNPPSARPGGSATPLTPTGRRSNDLPDPDDPGRYSLRSQPQEYLMSSTVPGPPWISADADARALREYFLANADRGDHTANDDLVAELVRRIRARQTCGEGRC